MAWCHQATSHYLNQCWPRSPTPYGIIRPQWVNSSPSGQNGRHFADYNFRCVFVNEMFCILIKISLKFVPKGPIDNNPTLVQIMAWHRIGDKPLSESMRSQFTDIYVVQGGDELIWLFQSDCLKFSQTYQHRLVYHHGWCGTLLV